MVSVDLAQAETHAIEEEIDVTPIWYIMLGQNSSSVLRAGFRTGI